PIHGFVDEVNAVPGQYLAAGTKAMTLLSREHLHVELVLFEKDAHKVQPGQKLELTSPDRPDQIFNASIFVVGKTINEQRQVYVHADLLDGKQEALLLPGMFLQARIQLDPSQGLAVPEEAVIEVGQEYYILIQKSINDQGYVLEKVKVIPGVKSKNYLSITPERSLDASTLVLVKGAYNLL
ncbi:MAG: efflux RND transporter periplasmic adaptor subunit, partial [Bacteroidota bacterium]